MTVNWELSCSITLFTMSSKASAKLTAATANQASFWMLQCVEGIFSFVFVLLDTLDMVTLHTQETTPRPWPRDTRRQGVWVRKKGHCCFVAWVCWYCFEQYSSKPPVVRGERLLQTLSMIGQEIQLSSSCPIRATELYISSNQSSSL